MPEDVGEFDALAEDVLLRGLAEIMNKRGFALLGVIALREKDGAVSTLGKVEVTQSKEFAEALRALADQIDGIARPAKFSIFGNRARRQVGAIRTPTRLVVFDRSKRH